jgi:hypothetical protein
MGSEAGNSRKIAAGVKGPLSAGSTVYALEDLTANATEVPAIVLDRTFARKLRLHLAASPGAGEDVTVTVHVNGVATSITATLDGDSATGEDTDVADTTNYVVVAPGDRVSFEVVSTNNGGFAARDLSIALECG